MAEAGIVTRHLRLRKQVLEPSDCSITFEGLIDALLVLYEECSHVKAKHRTHQIASFISTFQNIVHNYSKLRVNIGDFKVLRTIGRGNFADVQLVKERGSGKVYALKVMRKAGEAAPVYYCEERDIMARTSSPWLTKLDYAFQDSQHLYLAMEFHCGGDLLSLLDRNGNRLEEAAVRFYTAEVALGIHDLHKLGFVHRDIKPENILIDRTGHLKLADFGNAARLSTAGTVNKVMPVGTPDYIAPEVLQCLQSGEEGHGVACDYWSLGVLAYEMFHGTSPFTDLEGSVINTYANIMRHAERPVTFPEGTPAHLEALVKGLLKPAATRLGHHHLLRHPFYSSLDWNNLLNTTPPHVPQVSGEDDDSNFDPVDDSPPAPDSSSLKPAKEFRNLPFVGFTFTSDKGQAASLDKGQTSSLEAELRTKAHQLEKLKLRNFQLEQQALNHTRVAEGSVRDFEQVEKLSTQLNMAEQDNAELKSTVKNMERILEIERQDRAATEQKTISLLEDVRRKWSRAEEERMEVVRAELAKERERAEEQEGKWRESQVQLRKVQGDLEAVTGVKNQLKVKLKDYKQRLENVASLDEVRNKAITKLEAEKKEAEAEVSLCRSQLDESRVLDGKVDALQLIVEQRDQILAEKESELKMKISEASALVAKQEEMRGKITKLEEATREGVKEVAGLKEQLEAARKDGRVEVDSQLATQKQLKEEVKEAAKENAETKAKLKLAETEKKALTAKYEKIKTERNKASAELEKVKTERDRELVEKEVIYKKKMVDLEKVFETLQTKIDTLEKKGKSESGTDLKKKQINQLECKVEKLEVEKAKLANKVSEAMAEKEKAVEVVEKMKNEMIDLKKEHAADLEKTQADKSDFAAEMEDVAKLKEENEKLAQELKEVKLDLRIEKRELEKKAGLVTYIREREGKNKEKIEEMEKEKVEFEKEIGELKASVEDLKSASENVKKQEERVAGLVADIRKIKDEKAEVVIENRRLKTDASTTEAKVEKLVKKVAGMEEEAKTANTLKVNNEALQEVAGELEKQVMDYERLNERLEVKVEEAARELREAETKVGKEKEETRRAKIAANEEKSSRIHLEAQLREVRRRVDEAEQARESEKSGLEKRLAEYKALCQKLSTTLEDLTRDNVEKEKFGILNERMKSNLEVENTQLKEELSEKITQLNSHKESNFKLSAGIEEAIAKIEAKKAELANLRVEVEAEKRGVAEEVLRHQATQAQQAKLIDFLQTKVSALEGRKKTFSDKIFGNKENQRPGSGSSVPLAYSELEHQLEAERMKSKKVSQQLARARAEVVALKTGQQEVFGAAGVKEVLEGGADRGAESARSHNIPHRLVQATNRKSTKCPVCQESLGFMAPCQTCKHCHLSTHPPCSSSLPPTCGLPAALLGALPDLPPVTQRPLPPAPGAKEASEGSKEGPVKALISGSWRECHLSLSSTHLLDLYSDTTRATRIDQLGLALPHCRVSVQGSVSYSEVYSLSTVDRPYTFKLTTQSTGHPEKVLYLMCQSFAAKVDWVNRLEESIRTSPHNCSPPSTPLPPDTQRRLVASLPHPQEVLAVCMVGEEMVVGTSLGLSTVSREGLHPLQGLEVPVHRVHHLPSLHLLVVATGGSSLPSQLLTVSTLALSSPLQPLAVTPELTTCHTFSCTETEQGRVFLCAVSEDLVVILEWSAKRGAFVLRNKFSTDQPTACVHFTEQTVLVGTTKFYEIDLKSFSAEEFLDLSNPGVREVTSSPAFQGSLPKAVMRYRSPESGEAEYLLAFTRHILFVDSFGQEARPPLEVGRVALEHRLLGTWLVSSYSDEVELRQLAPPSLPCTAPSPTILHLPLSSPHLLAVIGQELMFSHQTDASNHLAAIRLPAEDF